MSNRIIQLDPPIPVITPKGKAIAHGWIDNGIEHDLLWICFQDNTGECWTWRNPDVRAQKNITEGRENISPFYDPVTQGLERACQKYSLDNYFIDPDNNPINPWRVWGESYPEIGRFHFKTIEGFTFMGWIMNGIVKEHPIISFEEDYKITHHGIIKFWRPA